MRSLVFEIINIATEPPMIEIIDKTISTLLNKSIDSLIDPTGIVKKKAQEPKGCAYCACRDVCTQYTKFKQMGLIK